MFSYTQARQECFGNGRHFDYPVSTLFTHLELVAELVMGRAAVIQVFLHVS